MENLLSRQQRISGGAANGFLQQHIKKTGWKASYHKGINSFLINIFCVSVKDEVAEDKNRNHRVQNRMRSCDHFSLQCKVILAGHLPCK